MLEFNDYEFFQRVRVKDMEVGKRYLVSSTDSVSPLTENGGIYPWGDVRHKIPVEVLEDHKYFYTVRVLPHWSHFMNFGKARPYRVSLMKKDISCGWTRVYITEKELVCAE